MVMSVKRGHRCGQRNVSRVSIHFSLTMRGLCVGIAVDLKRWIAMVLACVSTLRPINHHGSTEVLLVCY